MDLTELEILEMHAVGGMAEIYRAQIVGEDGEIKSFAVKKILPQYTKDKELLAMFIEEAKVAACLSFPNIVQVYDLCVSDNGEYFIVMEFADGKDLADIIYEAGLQGLSIPVPVAVYICREILSALEYAHQAAGSDGRPMNLIHRDISPHNIIIGYDGSVKLTDFGIAKVQQSGHKTMVGVVKGKFGYMSPEQARGKPLDLRSDLYNVGILLYEMITGERLFAGSSDISTIERMRDALVPELPETIKMPPELEQIMRASLSVRVSKRPPTAAKFEMALARVSVRYTLKIKNEQISQLVTALFPGKQKIKRKKRATRKLTLRSTISPESLSKKIAQPKITKSKKPPVIDAAINSGESRPVKSSKKLNRNNAAQKRLKVPVQKLENKEQIIKVQGAVRTLPPEAELNPQTNRGDNFVLLDTPIEWLQLKYQATRQTVQQKLLQNYSH